MFTTIKQLIETTPLPVDLTATTEDGRIDSAVKENLAIAALRERLGSLATVDTAKPRYWYDCLIRTANGQIFPTNVKITTGKGSDNISSKKGFYYSMTGENPDGVSGLDRWDTFIDLITTRTKPTAADYYFLVVFKEGGRALFTSLKRIETLTPNGNNLPFQCPWSKNLTPTNRTQTEQIEYLKSVFVSSYKQKVKGLDLLLERWDK